MQIIAHWLASPRPFAGRRYELWELGEPGREAIIQLMRHRIAATSFQKVSAPKRLTAGPASRLGAYVEMLHLPPILVVVGAATVITATASYPPQMSDLAMFIAALFVSQLAISVHNDYCDRELDAQVKPWRALPRGLVSPAQAVGLVVLLLMSAVA
ncbi:MAG: UbiA family prenyltransferase, partial [Dehalococcoidia bacterium]